MEPSASPKTLLDTLLEAASVVVMPDWRELVALFPIFLALLFVAWFASTARKYATVGPRRRAPARIQPVTPPDVHMPGGSLAPIVVAVGAGALFLGLILGGLALWIGVTLLVLSLLVWFREAMRDYDHIEPANRLPAVVHQGPPPGVHMPGPSTRPLLAALGSAMLLGGLVVGGVFLLVAVVFLVYTLLGWLIDATAEYRKVEDADVTGHLENIPERNLPKRALQVFSVLFLLVGLWQLGIFPPTAPATAGGDPGASPGASGDSGAPPGALPVVASGIAFDVKELEAAAGQPFTIFLSNEDPPTTPHDVDIRSSDGSETLQDQPTLGGGESQAFEYEPLEAGTYQFICSVHPIPAMTGTLTVQ
jgi:plastocyanin